ncbi:hypothetical protein DA102_018380 [Sinorhizobium meliloti]|nr:hypothetical protein DA102_018380 [Sinorhizobium meliloti]
MIQELSDRRQEGRTARFAAVEMHEVGSVWKLDEACLRRLPRNRRCILRTAPEVVL